MSEAIEVNEYGVMKINLMSLPSDVTLYVDRDIKPGRARLNVVFGGQRADFEAWVSAMDAEVTASEWRRAPCGAQSRLIEAEIVTNTARLLVTCSETHPTAEPPTPAGGAR